MNIPLAITDHCEKYCERLASLGGNTSEIYRECYLSTIKTAVTPMEDGTYFVLTGDIPAMWLRDSSAQVENYAALCADTEVASLIKGVLRRQFMYIGEDPYANAFNKCGDGSGHTKDLPPKKHIVWERKYEIDSLCWPVRLLGQYTDASGDADFAKNILKKAAPIIINVFRTEQRHMEKSPYRFVRPSAYGRELHHNGFGAPVAYTGMTWSGFRPSDDPCELGYAVPSNMFAAVALGEIARLCGDEGIKSQALSLRDEITRGIFDYGIVEHEKYGKIFASEVDGLGNYRLFDDANIPSLLSIPYLGFLPANDELYRNTRAFVLSRDNPYFFEGKTGSGIGSPHTPSGYIWHLALSMQGLTSDDEDEMRSLLDMLCATDAGTLHMHEGFLADDPSVYSRPWFTWSDSTFARFCEKYADIFL